MSAKFNLAAPSIVLMRTEERIVLSTKNNDAISNTANKFGCSARDIKKRLVMEVVSLHLKNCVTTCV